MTTYEHERFITGLRPAIRRIVTDAVADLGTDLGGCSVVDLVLDNEPRLRTSADAKLALRMADVRHWLSDAQRKRYEV